MQLFRGLIVIAMLSSNLAAANTSQNLTYQISQQYVNVINKNNEALDHQFFYQQQQTTAGFYFIP